MPCLITSSVGNGVAHGLTFAEKALGVKTPLASTKAPNPRIVFPMMFLVIGNLLMPSLVAGPPLTLGWTNFTGKVVHMRNIFVSARPQPHIPNEIGYFDRVPPPTRHQRHNFPSMLTAILRTDLKTTNSNPELEIPCVVHHSKLVGSAAALEAQQLPE